jgi:hypothetical protein
VATFSLFDFQAQVIARVFSGKAKLPETVIMREEYRKRLREKGAGRLFHSLRGSGAEIDYVADLVDWINTDGESRGFDPIAKHSEDWVKGYWAMREKMKVFLDTSD